jgi:hypothetical protein
MKGVIYKYTFPDGKVYIGQTRNPEKRKVDHIDPKIGPANTGFWEAYQRYGTYEYEVLREIENDDEDVLIDLLNRWESGYIYQYKADNPEYGYNRTIYGTVGIRTKRILKKVYNEVQDYFYNNEMQLFNSASEKIWETKEPLTEEELFLITEKYPDEMWLDKLKSFDFKNLRENIISENIEMYLEEHLDIVRLSIWDCSHYIASQYIRKFSNKIIEDAQTAHTIVQIDKEGNVIKEYASFLEICQAFNVKRADNVRNVLNGKQKSAYGYLWKYKKDL